MTHMRKKLQVYLEEEHFTALHRLADIEQRSDSNMAAVLLAECLEAKRMEWAKHRALPSIQNVERPRQSKKRRQWQEIEDISLSPSESE